MLGVNSHLGGTANTSAGSLIDSRNVHATGNKVTTSQITKTTYATPRAARSRRRFIAPPQRSSVGLIEPNHYEADCEGQDKHNRGLRSAVADEIPAEHIVIDVKTDQFGEMPWAAFCQNIGNVKRAEEVDDAKEQGKR